MREITLQEMLDARERRAFRQQALLTETGRPLISFCMNIPGPIKDSPLIRRGYREGIRRLEATLRQSGIPVLRREEQLAPTGPELLLSADAGAEALKALCLEIEEDGPMGRLFDMDVIAPDGRKLDRETPRCCIVCGRPGKECASRRAHSVGDLQRAVRKILTVSLLKKDAERVDALATAALIDEVNTTPKPGLVDLNNNGSHRDMEPDTFYRSARALCGFWGDCFTIGVDARTQPAAAAFDRLRQRGLEADSAMLAATGGVNTHKGAIFRGRGALPGRCGGGLCRHPLEGRPPYGGRAALSRKKLCRNPRRACRRPARCVKMGYSHPGKLPVRGDVPQRRGRRRAAASDCPRHRQQYARPGRRRAGGMGRRGGRASPAPARPGDGDFPGSGLYLAQSLPRRLRRSAGRELFSPGLAAGRGKIKL